ncbi:MAG TPA: MFS transporter [Bryobacteraceae bacterium]|jgi:MFS family permease|nr:MFS transporter [Bryobacteraceae bacterium]
MSDFTRLLARNRNYRWTWMGQIVSEMGDHFNNVAVLSLAMDETHSGTAIAAIMLSRAIPAIVVGPFAGVLLDRFDRRRIMIASDLVRGFLALAFILAIRYHHAWLLYLLSALLMIASPFFTSGRSAILPAIATDTELHTANSLTQTTGWMTLAIGAFFGGTTAARFGYEIAFVFNSLSFFFSAFCIGNLRSDVGHFRAADRNLNETKVARPWHEYREGLGYMLRSPLILGIGLISVGWASGGGAAQVLFTLFSEMVFKRGAQGLGELWGTAGVGLLIGGAIGNRIGKRVRFDNYKRVVFFCYLLHGGAYVVFSQMPSWRLALLFMGLSRASVAVSSVLNWSKLLKHVEDRFRGRVFSTIETMNWSTMMLSMMAAGIASQYVAIRLIGAVSGVLSSSTAIFWGWANWSGRLPEPSVTEDPENVEVHTSSAVVDG